MPSPRSKYREIATIGHGGFAKVTKVKDNNDNDFAMKTFDPQSYLLVHVDRDHLLKRFQREVKYQKTIKHRNVVDIIDSNLDDDPPWFVMNIAECTLENELSDQLEADHIKQLLFDILSGLEAIHEKGFVHRDLKPGNILKFLSDDESFYGISDFGLMSVPGSSSTTLTGTGARGGTEDYAAPELITSLRRATPAADIYSFGAILHDIFGHGSSRVPYTELSLPGDIGKIIEKCTKRLPIRRYRSISQLREELYEVLNTNDLEFQSTEEEDIVNILKSGIELSDDDLDKVFFYLEKKSDEGGLLYRVFSAITEMHIHNISERFPDLFVELGAYFCKHIHREQFPFDYCDVLVGKAMMFYEKGDLSLKAKITLALLELGTSHNRWYVERKFISIANRDISDNLAERIRIEIEVDNFDFEERISRLERSISISRNILHPILQKVLQVTN